MKISLVSLGCSKNLADLEGLIPRLGDVEIALDLEEAEIVFLNTCGFLESARNEVFQNMAGLKGKRIIVTGCMAALIGTNDRDFQLYKDVYAYVSESHYKDIKKIFEKVVKGKRVCAVDHEPTKFVSMPQKTLLAGKPYAYIKIAEGCNRMCSYCLIPYLKGHYRSRKMKEILDEAEWLVASGVKELILVAQDTGLYGIDLYKKKSLPTLLKKLAKIDGDFWIRLLYVYPETVDMELLKAMKSSKKICKFLDIPFQHGDSKVLLSMNRPNSVTKNLEGIENIRKEIPEIILRTTIMVGFPGETPEAFNNLADFVEKASFDRLGTFEFSPEPGTEADKFKDQIPKPIKRTRHRTIMLFQQKIALKKNKEFVGKTLRVLIDSYDDKQKVYLGHSQHFAPEVDGIIYVKSKLLIKLHNFQNVKITASKAYDLYGIVV